MKHCCKKTASLITTPQPTTSTTEGFGPLVKSSRINILNHENIDLVNSKSCGKVHQPDRIVGGSESQVNEFPWSALLKYQSIDDEKFQGFKCGGSLISNRYILTGKILKKLFLNSILCLFFA